MESSHFHGNQSITCVWIGALFNGRCDLHMQSNTVVYECNYQCISITAVMSSVIHWQLWKLEEELKCSRSESQQLQLALEDRQAQLDMEVNRAKVRVTQYMVTNLTCLEWEVSYLIAMLCLMVESMVLRTAAHHLVIFTLNFACILK